MLTENWRHEMEVKQIAEGNKTFECEEQSILKQYGCSNKEDLSF